MLDASNSGEKKSPALKKPRPRVSDDSGSGSKDVPKLLGQNAFTTGLQVPTRDSGSWNLVLVEKAFGGSVQLPARRSESCGGLNPNPAGLAGQLHRARPPRPPRSVRQSLSTYYIPGAGVQQ